MSTFLELRTELQARGFDYLSSTRANYFLNRAYAELCEDADWPFLETTATGAAPLAITDLRTIESVVDTTNAARLRPLDRRNIMDYDESLATTGTPSWYYLTTGGTVAVYPASTNSLSVRYWKFPTPLSADGDTPVVPTRFQQLIVDAACIYAYFDSDNFEAATEYRNLYEQGKAQMRDALIVGQHDQPDDYIHVYAGSEDW